MYLAIIIPTWKRVKKLQKCLESLETQEVSPELVIITVRNEDEETCQFLKEKKAKTHLNLQIIFLDQPGVIFAENTAISYVKNLPEVEVVTFMDDDAIAFPDWIRKIKDFFSHHSKAAALGGPDIIVSESWTYYEKHVEKVGLITFAGKVIGNHHHSSKGIRIVDTLKGVNMSIRKDFLELIDSRLQGVDPAKGNGVFWELDLCLKIKKKMGHIYFDPGLTIHHDSDHKHFIPLSVTSSTSHNLALIFFEHFEWRRIIVFIFYSLFIGHSHIKGVLKTAHEVFKTKNLSAIKDSNYSIRGFLNGIITWSK